jgi:hypothetical protein
MKGRMQMQIMRETREHLELGAAKLALSYRLFSQARGEEGTSYGIEVALEDTGEVASVEDITVDETRAVRLLRLLTRGTVTPVALRDVVEDFLIAD